MLLALITQLQDARLADTDVCLKVVSLRCSVACARAGYVLGRAWGRGGRAGFTYWIIYFAILFLPDPPRPRRVKVTFLLRRTDARRRRGTLCCRVDSPTVEGAIAAASLYVFSAPACHIPRVSCAVRRLDVVSAIYPPPPPPLPLRVGQRAQALLKKQKDGTYLIRKSNRTVDPYTLSVRHLNVTKHVQIKYDGTRFGLAAPLAFYSLEVRLCFAPNQRPC